MDYKTLGIILFVGLSIIGGIIMYIKGYKWSVWSYLIGWWLCSIYDIAFRDPKPKHITIEKSSDSEWVRSKFDYPDTTITSVKVMEHDGRIDTIYPTTVYKRIEL